MKHGALLAAANHLDLAAAAVEKMNSTDGFREYNNAWTEFLAQAGRMYSKLEQGSKGCERSGYWFGLRKHMRKNDPLLRYIHYARDVEEHCLRFSAAAIVDGVVPLPGDGRPVTSMSMMMMKDKDGKIHVRDAKATDEQGRPVPLGLINAKPVLYTVKSRAGVFEPPTMHLDQPIVNTEPLGIARLAIAYLSDMLEEAKGLPLRY